MHGRKNKENCALKLVDEIILYYDARSKKHQTQGSSTTPVAQYSLYLSFYCFTANFNTLFTTQRGCQLFELEGESDWKIMEGGGYGAGSQTRHLFFSEN